MRDPLRPRTLRLLLALSLLALAPGCASSGLHRAPGRVVLDQPRVEVPMQADDGRLLVQVWLDGEGPFWFLPDTGAEVTILSPQLARRLDLPSRRQELLLGGASGAVELDAEVVRVGELRVGGARFEGLEALVHDLPGEFDGLLGMSMFRHVLLTIDGPRAEMVLELGELPEADGEHVLAWDPGTLTPELVVMLCGRPQRVLLDTGFNGWLLLPAGFEEDLPIRPGALVPWHARDLLVAREARLGRLAGELRLGRFEVRDPYALFSMSRPLVGSRILSEFRATYDLRNRRLRLVRDPLAASSLAGAERPDVHELPARTMEAAPAQAAPARRGARRSDPAP